MFKVEIWKILKIYFRINTKDTIDKNQSGGGAVSREGVTSFSQSHTSKVYAEKGGESRIEH